MSKETTAVDTLRGEFSALLQRITDGLTLPVSGAVIGVPVSVESIEFDGNPLRGLTAVCRRDSGESYQVALADVVFPGDWPGASRMAAYGRWLRGEVCSEPGGGAFSKEVGKVRTVFTVGEEVELLVLSVKDNTAVCRLDQGIEEVNLRSRRRCRLVPGETARITVEKQWRYGGFPCLSGPIRSTRIDRHILGGMSLRLTELGSWEPEDFDWQGYPDEAMVRQAVAEGPQPIFEMEQVLPAETSDNYLDGPIARAIFLMKEGLAQEAREALMSLCRKDLRCLDAHSHLGNFSFDRSPETAIRHYEVGVCIGDGSLGPDFSGVLPWGCIDNRPYLRCLHGYGLSLWRLDRFREAEAIFHRMMRLNPWDNQGVRFILHEVAARQPWRDDDF